MIIRSQKNELNVFQVEEMKQENKIQNNDLKENKKDCLIFWMYFRIFFIDFIYIVYKYINTII